MPSLGDLFRNLLEPVAAPRAFLPAAAPLEDGNSSCPGYAATFSGPQLRAPVGNNRQNEEEDVRDVQATLSELGYLNKKYRDEPSGIIDRDTDQGIRRFQQAYGLRQDGWLAPKGETETALRAVREGRKSRYTLLTKPRGFALAAAPILDHHKDREKAILENKPARFIVYDDPKVKDDRTNKFFSEVINRGAPAQNITKYDTFIEKYAKEEGLNPDLVRAVMYAEIANGKWGVVDDILDHTPVTDTKLPMNINPKIWHSLIRVPPKNFTNPEYNIKAGTRLIRRITERMQDPTPAKIGAVWQGLSREEINTYNRRIENAYDERPWLK
jgi:peptidoglycan hydrolase-like protein with peptidoglycan-binding domain